MSKPHPEEFFQTEIDALAEEAGAALEDCIVEVTESEEDGVAGHTLSVTPKAKPKSKD